MESPSRLRKQMKQVKEEDIIVEEVPIVVEEGDLELASEAHILAT